ncbi:olfactory receptor 142-like [Anguilla anguilla]|uniref:olfactory receptor 142-like n=1 Tax=Anguilla anguilla TaxID=7936 RepID=UPI0015A78A90|nr:olfactory receptor 142-like [Anguilla anguilla]XP_035290546.1 olfactory receptor 142-like [Anguilla anguilla]
MENASSVTSVILTAFYEMEDLKYLYFIIFLLVYVTIVAENVILIVVIYVHRALHEPMYVFVCNLAFNELYGSTALLPPIMSNLVSETHEVSLPCCQVQIYCLHTYAITEFTILAVMGYDRYVAICHPLQYHSIMSVSKVCKCIAFSWLYPLIAFAVFYALTLQLVFCGSGIEKIYCTNFSLIKLSCTDTTVVSITGLLSLVVYSFPQLAVILYSYIQILKICIRSSKGAQTKALNTCIPHLLALVNYSVGCFFEICQSRLNIAHLHYGARIFLSLYFLIIPPILNPALYGGSIQAIRVRIFKLVKVRNCNSQLRIM